MEQDIDAVRDASRRLVRELGFLDDGRRTLGLTHAQCHALIETERAGAVTVSALAEVLGTDKSTASRSVARLSADGLLDAQPDPVDSRKKHLALSGAGKARLGRIHKHADQQVGAALSLLSEADRAVVVQGLGLYAEALRRARLAGDLTLRPIKRADDPQVAALIRTVMGEFGANGPGYAINDPEVEAMSRTYKGKRAGYFVFTRGERVVGGAGFAPLKGGPVDTCELRKMYFYPELRGLGAGARMLGHVLDAARQAGFQRCYLETLAHMHAARALYEKVGFQRLDAPLGDTGHFSCNSFYALDLDRRVG